MKLKKPFLVELMTCSVFSLSLMLVNVFLIESPAALALPLKSVSSYFFLIETPDYFRKLPTLSASAYSFFSSGRSFFE